MRFRLTPVVRTINILDLLLKKITPASGPVPYKNIHSSPAEKRLLLKNANSFRSRLLQSRDEHGPEPDRSRILTFFGWIGSEPNWALVPDRSRIVLSMVCQLKYAMSYVRKSKRRIE